MLELNKTPGSNAIANALTVGDHVGAAGNAVVRLLQANQIPDNFTLTLNAEGAFDLNGLSDTIGGLVMAIAPTASSTVASGAGTLTVAGNITVNVVNGGMPVAATISGNLALGGAAARTITVNDSAAVEDLVISATISDAAAGWTKTGAGRLVLPAPTRTPTPEPPRVGAGELVIRNAPSLGTGATGTVVNSTANGNLATSGSLIIDGNLTDHGEAFRLNTANSTDGNQSARNGGGFQGSGALRVLAGRTVVWNSDVVFGTNSTANNAPRVTINVESGGDLIINGAISQTGQTVVGVGLNKIGHGALEFAGTTANTFGSLQAPGTAVGTTVIAMGTLRLNKTAGVAALAGRVEVGNNLGAAGSDRLVWMQSNQYLDQLNVANALFVIESTGFVDLNGQSETIVGPTVNSFFTRIGTTASGTLDLKGGTLTFGDGTNAVGHWGAGLQGGLLAMIDSPAGRIFDSAGTGNVVLANNNAGWDTGAFTLQRATLQVDATITNTGTGRILKAGAGALAVTANNTGYTGTTNLSAGILALGNNGALGSNTLNATGAGTVRAVAGGSAIVLPNAVTLNSNLTVGGDAAFTFNGSVSGQGAADRTLTAATETGSTVTLAGAVNLSNDAAARNLIFVNNTFNAPLMVTGVVANGSGAVHTLRVNAGNEAVVLSNSNIYTGTTFIATNALLRITNSNALGAGVNAVVEVSQGGALEIDGSGGAVNVTDKVLRIRATGSFGAGFKTMQFGAVRNLAGANSWTNDDIGDNVVAVGAIDLRGENDANDRQMWIAADGASSLNIVGQIAGTQNNAGARQGHTLVKTGTGTIRYSGTTANLNTGQTTIYGGTLELNKTAGVNAIAGGITVGDGGGGAGSDVLRLIQIDQIPVVTITVAPSGTFDLNGLSDAIGALTLQRGDNVAATVNTGAGTLTLGGTVTVQNAGASDNSTPAAVINGLLALGAARDFNIDDSLRIGSGDDLIVNAVISGGFALNKNGFGTMVLTGNNTYTGTTTVNTGTFVDGISRLGGSLVLRGNGDIAQSSGITVNTGGSLVLDNFTDFTGVIDRIGNAVGITLAGGELVHIGSSTTAVVEQVGSITINAASTTAGGNSSLIRSIHNGFNVELTGVNLARGAGGTVHFVGEGVDLGGTANRVRFTGTIANVSNNTLTWATLDQVSTAGLEFVRHDATNGIDDAAFVTSLAAATLGTENVKLSASEVLLAPKTINALLLNGADLDVCGDLLTITGGQVINLLNSTLTSNLAFGASEIFFFVEAATTLAVNGTITGTGALRKQRDGTLVLSNDNTGFTGAATVDEGVLRLLHGGALGTAAGGTTVSALAAMVLDGPLTITAEPITINGTGVNNDLTGALRVINGNSTIGSGTTAFNMGSATSIFVEGGRSLTLNATVGTNTFAKMGEGILELGGTAANTGTGAMTVQEGTLRAQQDGTAIAVTGTLTIGKTRRATANR